MIYNIQYMQFVFYQCVCVCSEHLTAVFRFKQKPQNRRHHIIENILGRVNEDSLIHSLNVFSCVSHYESPYLPGYS